MKFQNNSLVEVLENRIAPAGLITVTVSGGNLTLNGDVLGNDVTIEQVEGVPGSFTITGNDGTLLQLGANGEDVGVLNLEGITGNVGVNLKGGDDYASFAGAFEKNLTVNLGEGNNHAGFHGVDLAGGSLTVRTGGGDDSMTLSGDVAISNDLIIDLKHGNNSISSKLSSLDVGGKFYYDSGNDSDSISLGAGYIHVGGTTTLRLGGGANSSYFGAEELVLDGNVSVTSLNHVDDVVEVSFEGYDVTFGGNVTIVNGNGLNFTELYAADDLDVAGNVSITNGHSLSTVEEAAYYGTTETILEAYDMDIDGNVTIKNGNGYFYNAIEGDDEESIGDYTEVDIEGDVTIINGNNAGLPQSESPTECFDGTENILGADEFDIDGKLTIRNGNGAFDTDGGAEYFSVGSVNVVNGSSGEGETRTSFSAYELDIYGDVVFKDGAGYHENYLGGFAVEVEGNVTATGSGVAIAESYYVNVVGNVTVNSEAGGSYLDLGAQQLEIGGNVTLNGGAGNDYFSVHASGESIIAGKVLANLKNEPQDEVLIPAAGYVSISSNESPLQIGEGIVVNMNTFANSGGYVNISQVSTPSLTIKTGAGSDNIELYNAVVTGVTDIQTLGGDDDVDINNLLASGALKILTGAGSDEVGIQTDAGSYPEQFSLFSGPVLINLGADADFLGLGDDCDDTAILFAQKTEFDGGTGENYLDAEGMIQYFTLDQPVIKNFGV